MKCTSKQDIFKGKLLLTAIGRFQAYYVCHILVENGRDAFFCLPTIAISKLEKVTRGIESSRFGIEDGLVAYGPNYKLFGLS